MSKLTRKEKDKITAQMSVVRRGETWVGIRPVIMQSGKYNKKASRRESRKLCSVY